LTELQAAFVECNDNSDGSCGGGAKLELVVVSEKFEGLALLKRHRLVNDCLAEFMPQIHAITMKTWTPQQYESKK
jgi:stress-induced morphogen